MKFKDSLCGRPRAAADEVDDFEFVAIGELGFGPAVAANEFAIQFDGDAIGFHAELCNKFREG